MRKNDRKNIQPRSRDFHDMAMALKDEVDTTKKLYHRGKKQPK